MAGFSYTEVLVATFLIAVILAPALESLHSGIQGSAVHATRVIDYQRLSGKLEEVLARPFSELEQAADSAGGPAVVVADYSDAVGTASRRLVYLARYDGDNADGDNNPFSGTDQGLLWVRVQLEGTAEAMQTLTLQ
jgi:type II secretory pathway component PulJ